MEKQNKINIFCIKNEFSFINNFYTSISIVKKKKCIFYCIKRMGFKVCCHIDANFNFN